MVATASGPPSFVMMVDAGSVLMIENCDIRDPQSSHNRDIRDSLFRGTRENRGMDGPTEIQRWLAGNLAEMGHGAKGRLADYMGVRPDAVTRMLNWEPGKERRVIDAEHLVKMSEFFGKVPPGLPDAVPAEETAERPAFHDGWHPRFDGGIAQLDARAGAGEGSVGQVVTIECGGIASGHMVTAEWVVPRDVLDMSATMVFALPVDGTSMEPGLSTDDIVFVDRRPGAIKAGEVYVVDEGDGPMVKRIRLDRDQDPPRLWIISDNPAVPPFQRPADAVRVIGRVIGKFVRM